MLTGLLNDDSMIFMNRNAFLTYTQILTAIFAVWLVMFRKHILILRSLPGAME